MAAVTAGYEWNRSSPLRSSPDTSSSMHPDRPIRPLPRRSLRARLSPEQAEHIVYPQNPPSTGPLFNFPYSVGERGNRSLRTGENDHHACHCGHTHSEVESEEEEDERGGPLPSSPSYQYSRLLPGRSLTGGAGTHHHKPGSASSSVDGYESFENTNNKKKRKIPNMGSSSSHHASLSADLAGMGIAQTHETDTLEHDEEPSHYYGSAPVTPQHSIVAGTGTGTGISGAGRGRFGRSASERSERRVLGTSINVANAKASSKRPPEQSGIISTAIANAQATPPAAQGNENVSLLHQEAAKNSANKTQFTFTCGSDSANKMVWPGQENDQYPQPPGAYPNAAAALPPHRNVARARPPVRPDGPDMATQGTQTSPNRNGTTPYLPVDKNAPPPPKGGQPQQQPTPPRKPRRSATKLYEYAARKRRIQQEYANFHNPPSQPWICEFCEYEDIFGHQPMALIRQYEKKDRQERRRLAEKRRLLEKARMKGRKGKKTSKKAQNNAPAAQQDPHPLMPGCARRAPTVPLDVPDDDYYDEYDDASPAPTCPHGCQHHPHSLQSPPSQVPSMSLAEPQFGGPPLHNGI